MQGNLDVDSNLRQHDERTYYRLAEERRRFHYRDRHIDVRAWLSRTEARYVVRDEGPEFDPARLPEPRDPTNPERVGGRSLLLIRTFMDERLFNASGNPITLIKRAAPSPAHG